MEPDVPRPPRRWPRVAAALVAAGLGGAVLAGGCSGTRPDDLGVRNGRLAPCPTRPNCVSSQADPGDAEHYVAPYTYSGGRAAALARLLVALGEESRTEVITQRDDYVYAEATSFLFRFVDDVEFYLPAGEAVIHCRSASRLGHSDLGVNRRRIERIRERFVASAPEGESPPAEEPKER